MPTQRSSAPVVVDSSALVAIVLGDAQGPRFATFLRDRPGALVSAANAVEAAIVVEARQGMDAARDLELLLSTIGAEIAPVDSQQVVVAIEAWRRFGKGRHPAGLNYGDCFAYALARTHDAPLLFQGGDFAQTDISQALAPT